MMTPSSPSHQEHPSSTSSRPSSKTNGCSSLRPLLKGAYHDIRKHQLFSPFYTDRVLDYFDGVIGLVSVFLYEELDYDQLLNAREDPTALLLSLLCYFHVMVFFLNVHHFLKFSPNRFSILQVWLIFAASLGLVCYPLSLAAWIEQGGGASMDYIIINTSICFVFGIFNFLTTIDERANGLYRVWHRFAPLVAFVYYGIALVLNLTGVERSIYMVYIAPFTFMFPLGAAKDETDNSSPLGAARDEADNSSHENNEIETQQQVNIFVEAFYDVKKRNIFSPYPSSDWHERKQLSSMVNQKWTEECDLRLKEMVSRFAGNMIAWKAIADSLNGLPCFKAAFPKGVVGTAVQARYADHLDPSRIRGIFTNVEIKKLILLSTLVPANSYTFIANVLGRTDNQVKSLCLSKKWFIKPLVAKLKELTGRTELKNDEGKFDFGSDANREQCAQDAVAAYRKKNPIPSNDPRIRDESTLTDVKIASLANEFNLKSSQVKQKTAKRKVQKEQLASKRAKKEKEVLASLKTEEELEKLESKEKAAKWVKVKESARETILAAGHTAQALNHLVHLARVEFKKNPLGRGLSGAAKERNAKKTEKNRMILADLDNNTM